MTAWAVVLSAALCTYLLRASALVTVSGGRLPSWVMRRIELVAAAALGALITSSALHNERAAALGLASVAAFAAARRFRSPYTALVVGFSMFYTLGLALFVTIHPLF